MNVAYVVALAFVAVTVVAYKALAYIFVASKLSVVIVCAVALPQSAVPLTTS